MSQTSPTCRMSRTLLTCQMNHVGCNREIDQKGKCIHDGGNHGGGHDGGVEADFICQKRQTAAHQFGKNNDKHEGEADGKRNRHIDAIEEHQFDKVGGRECDAKTISLRERPRMTDTLD